MITREKQDEVIEALNRQPAVGLLGPRQVGKTTLAKLIAAKHSKHSSVYVDLESPIDAARLDEPIMFFKTHLDKLIILDEIQRLPGLFPTLRGVIDEGRQQGRKTGRFLILGSASLELLKQASETLAGRVAYIELDPLAVTEISRTATVQNELLLRGGFPPSYLAENEIESMRWRQDFIASYLERDIPLFGSRVPAATLRRFWTMLAHTQGQPFNASRLSAALSLSAISVGRYLDLLVDLFLVRRLSPWLSNTGKRLTRSPKVYIRDSGLLHALLNINSFDALLGHPTFGASFEGLVIENLLTHIPFATDAGFYRTASGAEIDLVLSLPNGELWAIEIKHSSAPKLERGFHHACQDLKPNQRFVVYSGEETFPLKNDVIAISLSALVDKLLAMH